MYIQTNLSFLRSKHQLTYRELSKQTGVSFSAIKKIESKDIANPKVLTLLKLTRFFNISIDNFINTDLTKKCTSDWYIRR